MGLLDQQMQAGQQSQEPDKQQAELAAYQAISAVTEKQSVDALIAKAKQGNPAQAIADVLTPVIQTIWKAAESAGKKPDQMAFIVAARDAALVMATMLASAKLISAKDIQQVVIQALEIGAQKHNQSAGQAAPQNMTDMMQQQYPNGAEITPTGGR